jgi:hypothetical protein
MRAHADDCFWHDGQTYAFVDVEDLADLVRQAQGAPAAAVEKLTRSFRDEMAEVLTRNVRSLT